MFRGGPWRIVLASPAAFARACGTRRVGHAFDVHGLPDGSRLQLLKYQDKDNKKLATATERARAG
jgi:hypothetical protein